MIREHSRTRLLWDSVILLLVVVSCLLVPYQLAFSHSGASSYTALYLFIDALFLIDIGLNFGTSYRSRGVEVIDPVLTRKHYLKTLFAFDLAANLPLALVMMAMGVYVVSQLGTNRADF